MSGALSGTDPACLANLAEDQLFMHSGCASGQVYTWQLKESGESRPVGPAKQMHWAQVVSIYCLPVGGGDAAGGAMVTSGADNCLKVICAGVRKREREMLAGFPTCWLVVGFLRIAIVESSVEDFILGQSRQSCCCFHRRGFGLQWKLSYATVSAKQNLSVR